MRSIVIVSVLIVCGAASAYAASNPLGGQGKYNTDKPIEITADALDVFQEEHRAVFSGHVVAIQGDVRLKSDKMNVFYKQQDEAAPKAKNTAGEQEAIDKIEVSGNVFLSTPQETASGEIGVYDVAGKQIHLNNQVVLTREKNVLKGDHLTYNIATGKSVITGGKQDENKGRRVRALFVPDKAKGAQ